MQVYQTQLVLSDFASLIRGEVNEEQVRAKVEGHLTPDYVKLDGSFAQEVESSEVKKQELKDMVESLQSTGVLTAISGVESPLVLSTLWQAGINFIQGFYISPPLEKMKYDFASEGL